MLVHLFINLNPSKIYDFSDVQQHIQQKRQFFPHTKNIKILLRFFNFSEKTTEKMGKLEKYVYEKILSLLFRQFFSSGSFQGFTTGTCNGFACYLTLFEFF